jgi:hypothetical protein
MLEDRIAKLRERQDALLDGIARTLEEAHALPYRDLLKRLKLRQRDVRDVSDR